MAESIGEVWVELKVDGKALKKELADIDKRISESKKKQAEQEKKEKATKSQKQSSPSGIKGEEPNKKLSEMARKEKTRQDKDKDGDGAVGGLLKFQGARAIASRFGAAGLARGAGVAGVVAGGAILFSILIKEFQAIAKSEINKIIPEWLGGNKENYGRGVDEIWNEIDSVKAWLLSWMEAKKEMETMLIGMSRSGAPMPNIKSATDMYENIRAVKKQETELSDWFERKRKEDAKIGKYNQIWKWAAPNSEGK